MMSPASFLFLFSFLPSVVFAQDDLILGTFEVWEFSLTVGGSTVFFLLLLVAAYRSFRPAHRPVKIESRKQVQMQNKNPPPRLEGVKVVKTGNSVVTAPKGGGNGIKVNEEGKLIPGSDKEAAKENAKSER